MPTSRIALAAALASLAVGLTASPAADVPDLAKLDRSLKKEPAYLAKPPLYGLAAFGPKAEARVWMVLDKSKPDADSYDVLHIDLDADGDLTGTGERLAPREGRPLPSRDIQGPGHRRRARRVLRPGDVRGRAQDGHAQPAVARASSSSAVVTPRTRRPGTCGLPRSRPTPRWCGSTGTARSGSSGGTGAS